METYPIPTEYKDDYDKASAFEEGYDRGNEYGYEKGTEDAANEFATLMNAAIDSHPENLHEQVEKITKIVIWGNRNE